MKMKGNGMRAVMVLALSLLATTVSASFPQCYVKCFAACVVTKQTPVPCAVSCLKQCISIAPTDSLYRCNLDCACSKCSNISTKQNPAVGEVEACVNTCSETCKKH
uniref:Thionin-like protein 2 n=1 Tax=Nelumbo nucifera TaxID=4432 RepID=A0A822ZMY7_NELNU|nr:TPA_asm: hypothetical protein HUJ06_002969 [Nelumbo nucifera]